MNKAAMKTVMYVQVFLKERLLQVGYWALRHIPLRNFFFDSGFFKHLKHQAILLIK